MPHFDEIPAVMLSGVRLMMNGLTLVGIEGNTALVVDGDVWEVLGTGGVTIWGRKAKRRYTQGLLER